ncbi:MAG: peptidase U62 [Acidobacteriota bacterium]|nr:peptidase U62 [Acidobacteriota bacterium]
MNPIRPIAQLVSAGIAAAPSPILAALFCRNDGKLRLSVGLFFARLSRARAALLLTVCLIAPSIAAAQPTRAAAEKDPVLKAMLTELDRSMSRLQLPGFSKPFFIQYRIEDVDDFTTKAEFGASEGSQRTHQRVARVTVQVGDYKTDSSGSRGGGALELAALDGDPIALRSALWVATDQAYKSALTAYAQKQAALKDVETPPQAGDFSHEKPLIALADPPRLKLDEAAWVSRVARDSGIYRTDATVKASRRDVQYSAAEFHARATTAWLVNSEGTILRKGAVEYQEVLGVGTQAPDGMRLDRSYATTGASLADLDAPAAFEKHAVALIASLSALRKAPLVQEEYHGPLLLSADAAAGTLRVLLAGAVTATRPRLGTEARTNGPFASSYRTHVLPAFLDVVDDPGLKSYEGKGLLGAYDVDEEGVPAQAVTLVTAGRLENYLIGRQPVRGFPQSNGHGRAGITGPPRPAIGVLKVSARNGVSDEELNRKLVEMAKDRGLQSVFYVQTLGAALMPRLLYRVSLDGSPAGKRELVRGAEMDDVDQRALRASVVAAGKDLYVANYFGDIPQTVLAPALLLEDATIRRANEKNEKLPFYPPPD